MPFKIELNESECIGCGACVAACQDFFEMEGDKAKAKKKEAKDIGCAQDAADGCPVSCIHIKKI
jgi:ferredoxin